MCVNIKTNRKFGFVIIVNICCTGFSMTQTVCVCMLVCGLAQLSVGQKSKCPDFRTYLINEPRVNVQRFIICI